MSKKKEKKAGKHLKNIDIAFLPVNQPYTMTLEQALNAARMVKPTILYPITTTIRK